MTRVSVEEKSDDGLTCHETKFWLDERVNKFILDSFYVYTRKTKRHGYLAKTIWNRLDKRHNTIDRPFVTSETTQKALEKYVASLTFEDGL